MFGECLATDCCRVDIKSVLSDIWISEVLRNHFSLFGDPEATINGLSDRSDAEIESAHEIRVARGLKYKIMITQKYSH